MIINHKILKALVLSIFVAITLSAESVGAEQKVTATETSKVNYHQADQKMTWSEASVYCQERKSRLLPHNQLMLVLLHNSELNRKEPYWAQGIGLSASEAWFVFMGKRDGLFVSETKTTDVNKKLLVMCEN